MALELLIRSKKKKCSAAKHSVYFFQWRLFQFLTAINSWRLKELLPHTDAGLYGNSKYFTASFLLKFLYNSVSFLFLFHHLDCTRIRCWIAWTLHKSPLTALYSAAWFFHSYVLFLEQHLLLRCCVYFHVWSSSVSWDLWHISVYLFLVHTALLVASCPSFLVLLLLGNFLYLSS